MSPRRSAGLAAGLPVRLVTDRPAAARVLAAELRATGADVETLSWAELQRDGWATPAEATVVLVDDAPGVDVVCAWAREFSERAGREQWRLVLLTSAERSRGTAAFAGEWDLVLFRPVRPSSLVQLFGGVPPGRAHPGRPSRVIATPRQGGRVLVVDDNAINQKLVLRYLARLGYAADGAHDGLHALELLSLQSYDAIVMDCQMPRLDGFETTRRIRRGDVAGVDPAIPIIAFTAVGVPGDRAKCAQAGMDEFLEKPLRVEALQDVLSRVVRPGRKIDRREEARVLDPNQLEHLNALQDDQAPEFLRELIDLFLKETPVRLAELHGAHARQDTDQLVRTAHTLKGACASFGARELQSICAEIEVRARSGRSSQIDEFIAGLEPAYRRLHQALKSHQRKVTA